MTWNAGIIFNLSQEMKGHSLRTTVISCLPIWAIVLYGLYPSPIQFVHLIWNPLILCNFISAFNYLTCSFSWVATWNCTESAYIPLKLFLLLHSFFFFTNFLLLFYQNVFIPFQCFLNPNLFSSGCLFLYHLFGFTIPWTVFLPNNKKKKVKKRER